MTLLLHAEARGSRPPMPGAGGCVAAPGVAMAGRRRDGGVEAPAGGCHVSEAGRLDPLAGPEWDRLVSEHPCRTVFHTSGWARVLSRTYGHTPCYLRFHRGSRTTALVPVMEVRSWLTGRRGVSLPFSDYCEPLLFTDDAEADMLMGLAGLAKDRRWRHLEIRGGRGAGEAPTYYGHLLDLGGGEEALWAGVSGSVRRAIRKARREGLRARVSRSPEAMDQFVALHGMTRRRHGLPPQPASFFRNIERELIATGAGFVVTAETGGRAAAAAVFLHSGTAGIYKFSASDRSCWELRPNNLVVWEGICALVREGVTILHFGRSASQAEGLRRFKRSWGARETAVRYRRLDCGTNCWVPVIRAAEGRGPAMLFRRFPQPLNKLAGRLIYPHRD